MKRLSLLLVLVTSVIFYQNCAQNNMSFEHLDSSSALGIGLKLVPDDSNVQEISQSQKYTLEVVVPDKGEISRESITINGAPVNATKNTFGNYNFSFVTSEPRNYKILAEVWTPTGARFETSADLSIIDDQGPLVIITADPANKYEHVPPSTQNFLVQIQDQGGGTVGGVRCSLNGQVLPCPLTGSNQATVQTTGLGGGTYHLVVEASDNFGNITTQTHVFPIGADGVAPIVSIVPDANNSSYTIDSQKFVLTAKDDHSGLGKVYCALNGVALTVCPPLSGGSVTLTVAPGQIKEGINTLVLKAEDKAIKQNVLNPNSKETTYSFVTQVDKDLPTILLAKDSANTNLVNQNQKVAFEVKDAGSGIKAGSLICQIKGNPVSCSANAFGQGTISFTPSDIGTFTVQVSVQDRYSNSKTDSITLDIVRDSNVPVVSIAADISNPAIIIPGTVASFNFSVKKDGNLSSITSVRCLVDGVPVTCQTAVDKKSGSFKGTFATVGKRNVQVEATDSTGNVGQKTYEVIVNSLVDSTSDLAVRAVNDLDVLMVVDDSASMKDEQINMANRISSFTTELAGLNWRAGVITTDVTNPKTLSLLQPIVGAPNLRWVDRNTANVQKLIGDTVTGVGLKGSGTEQGIKASYRLLAAKDNGTNAGFFRPNAALAILVISDENESANTVENKPANLIALVQSLWPSKPFRVHSIVKVSAACGTGSIGTTYMELSNITSGVIGCISDANYSTTLAKMGKSTAELVNSATLTCLPYNNKVVLKKDGAVQNVAYTITGQNIQYAQNLPLGAYTLSYQCVK